MNLKKENGITMIALSITIIILIILSSVTIVNSKGAIQNSRFYRMAKEIKVMQEYVNSLYQESKTNDAIEVNSMGDSIDNTNSKITSILNNYSITDYTEYRYWSSEYIKTLGIDGITKDYLVNVNKRDVIFVEGIENGGKTYYKLEELPGGTWNVEND